METRSPRINRRPEYEKDWVCTNCGEDEGIEAKLWVNLKTFQCTDSIESSIVELTPSNLETHCPNCGTDVFLRRRSYYEQKKQEEEDEQYT